MKKVFSFLLVLLNLIVGTSQELASLSEEMILTTSKDKSGFIYYSPHNVFEQPSFLLSSYDSRSIPIDYYTLKEIELQKSLNAKEESIITFSGGNDRFFPRRIDREDITPYTWKWVHLQVQEEDGSYTNINLRRPNWWFTENEVTAVGEQVHISIPQIGLDKEVFVVKIYPNQLDTRLWEDEEVAGRVNRPITGKVEHYVNNVVDLYFEGSAKPLSVTINHLLWSYDRDDWVKVETLTEGEKITTKEGVVTVKEKIKKEGWYVVYDLEVYRDHNFLVGTQNVLAHNGCDDVVGIDGDNVVLKDGSKVPRQNHQKTDKDIDFKTVRGARREAMRRQGIVTSKPYTTQIEIDPIDRRFRIEVIYDAQTGQEIGRLKRHQNGHYFDDTHTGELPHYHDSEGSHINHEQNKTRGTNTSKDEKNGHDYGG